MGTYEILRLLLRYWSRTNHPIFRAEDRHLMLVSASQFLAGVVGRLWKPFGAIAGVMLMLAAVDFLCGGTRHTFSSTLFSACSLALGSFILFAILLLTYLWPVTVAVAASAVIAQERERRTSDVLLTTPFDLSEILLVKLAAALRRFNPYSEIFLWVQALLIAIIFVLVMGKVTRDVDSSVSAIAQLPLVFLTMAEFAIARAQDYVLSGIIGLTASLLTPNRQIAASVALLASVGGVLIRALMTTMIVLTLGPRLFPEGLVLLSTGPSS